MQLNLFEPVFSVCRVPRNHSGQWSVPEWAQGDFVSVALEVDCISVVCQQENVPAETQCEPDWRLLQVQGPLDFGLTGVLDSLTRPLAQAGISIFATSTFDTDYLMVRSSDLDKSIEVLRSAGHEIRTSGDFD